MVRDENQAEPRSAQDAACKFVWPPGPPDFGAGPPVLVGETPARGRARAAAIEIERVWLGLTRPPMTDRMLEAGWLPDSPDQYCPRCGEDAGPFEADFDGCPACRSKRLAWDVAVRLGCYDGLLREMILEFKHGPWRRLGQDLGRLLGVAVADRLRLMRIDPARVIVTPVPTTTRRRLSRGVDHTLVLAREVSRATGCRLVRAIGRQHRPPQSRLPMSARKGNVAGVFRVRSAAARLGRERVMVVVDDVRTTGATMTGVCRTLGGGRRASAVCWAATLGVASVEGSGSDRSGSGETNSGAGSA